MCFVKSNTGETTKPAAAAAVDEGLFQEIDLDGDGFITLGELRDALDKHTGRNYEQYFKKYDRNSDAKINFEGRLTLWALTLRNESGLKENWTFLEFKAMIAKF